MKNHPAFTFIVAALFGATTWLLAPWVIGHQEPWDGDGTYYFVALLVTGIAAGMISPKPVWALYTGVFIGQFGYQLLFLEVGSLVLVGVGTLLVCGLVFVVAALVASKLWALLVSQRKMAGHDADQ